MNVLSLNNSKISKFNDHIFYINFKLRVLQNSVRLSDTCVGSEKCVARIAVKRANLYFPIINFPISSSNIPSTPASGVYVGYTRA